STYDNLVKNIMAFFGYTGNLAVAISNPIITPIWGEPGVNTDDVFFIKSHYGSSPALIKGINAALTEDVTANTAAYTNVPAGLHHASRICVGNGELFVGSYDSGTYKFEIYRLDADGTGSPVAYYPTLADDAAKWYDPDYLDGSAFVSIDSKPRLVAGHLGDIVAYVAVNPANSTTKDAVVLTDFQTSNLDDETIEPKCYQPTWSPDGDKVVFVYRPPTPLETPAKSGIYVLTGVKAVIGGGSVYTSIDDARIIEIYATGKHPAWAPSFSQNGDVVSFSVDTADTFNNRSFALLGHPDSTDTFNDVMTDVTFDIYVKDIVTADVYFASQAASGLSSQAFLRWAPEGGDKILNSQMIPRSNGSSGFALTTFSDINNEYGGFTTRSGSLMSTRSDFSGSVLSIPGEPTDYGYEDMKVSPVSKIIEIPESYVHFGAARDFKTIPSGYTFPENSLIELKFRKASISAFDMDDYSLELFYISDRGDKRLVKATILESPDGLYLTAYAKVTDQGTYAVLAVPKASLFDDLTQARVFPNPARFGTVEGSTNIDRVVVDKLPDTLSEINIYNIAGEKVATMGEGVEFVAQADVAASALLPGAFMTNVQNAGGAAAVWEFTNDDGNAVASGVYFIVMTTEDGETVYKKVALVK
ncbi:hypothetical protein KAU32_07555, partial [bacterium]|nr:hypothetical protein [bacterium]